MSTITSLNEGEHSDFRLRSFRCFLDSLFGFFCPKTSVFRFCCSLRFADFPLFCTWFSAFVKNTNEFSDLVSNGFRFFLFGFRFELDLSGNYSPPLISNNRETSLCSTSHHCIGTIRLLITGMLKFIGFDGFACSLRFWLNSFCGFAVVDVFFNDGLRFLIDPNAPLVAWNSTQSSTTRANIIPN